MIAAVAALMFASSPVHAEDVDDPLSLPPPQPGRCLIKVDGKTYVDSPCTYIDKGDHPYRGLFLDTDQCHVSVYEYPPGNPPWFAWWNGCNPNVSHEHERSNAIEQGACWRNDREEFCLWKEMANRV
jgi:hypothetical protein